MGCRPAGSAVAAGEAAAAISHPERPSPRRRVDSRRPADVDHHRVGQQHARDRGVASNALQRPGGNRQRELQVSRRRPDLVLQAFQPVPTPPPMSVFLVLAGTPPPGELALADLPTRWGGKCPGPYSLIPSPSLFQRAAGIRAAPPPPVRRAAITTGTIVTRITNETTTFTSGSLCPSRMAPKIQIGSVFCAPAVNVVTITSSNESAKASMAPATTAVEMSGSVMSRKV